MARLGFVVSQIREIEDEDEGVRCVAAAAVLIDDPTDWAAKQRLTGGLSAAPAIGALHVLRHVTGRDVCATIAAIGRFSHTPEARWRWCACPRPAPSC
jgi:hypothetical protein